MTSRGQGNVVPIFVRSRTTANALSYYNLTVSLNLVKP